MKKWVFRFFILLFATVFLISAGFLADYFFKSRKHAAQFEDLSALVEQAQQQSLPTESAGSKWDGQDPGGDLQDLPESAYTTVAHPDTGESVRLLREYAAIFQKNPDLVGWIQIEGTKLNYPVMQTVENPNFYLTHDFYGEYSNHGCIYVSELCDVAKPSDNLTVYGHKMKDGSMFAALHNYMDEDFFREHPTIVFNTLTEYRTYEIFSVFLTTASAGEGFRYHEFVDAASSAEFDAFADSCKALSLYETGTDITFGDKLITLSTCEYSQLNGRLVVVARQIH